ncbi:hypothetical protein DB30_02439 [Enhygromyxa salina]|uniref:Uncharacterized protein n=1 Tax=Enhygromyxa salina TaxID=215803 RepID=A0A0C2CVA2_9BACT|nr:hypothetical protein DB30_02439 [Enhygromyxa salina]
MRGAEFGVLVEQEFGVLVEQEFGVIVIFKLGVVEQQQFLLLTKLAAARGEWEGAGDPEDRCQAHECPEFDRFFGIHGATISSARDGRQLLRHLKDRGLKIMA